MKRTESSANPCLKDVQNKCWLLLMKGELYWAPLHEPKNVLDVVCYQSHGLLSLCFHTACYPFTAFNVHEQRDTVVYYSDYSFLRRAPAQEFGPSTLLESTPRLM